VSLHATHKAVIVSPLADQERSHRSSLQHWNKQSTQIVLAAMAGCVALAGALTANWVVSRFGVSPDVAGSAVFCAAWIALFPLARLNRKVPRWAHWARGAFVLIVLWLLIAFARW
jgi:hypothetical protein